MYKRCDTLQHWTPIPMMRPLPLQMETIGWHTRDDLSTWMAQATPGASAGQHDIPPRSLPLVSEPNGVQVIPMLSGDATEQTPPDLPSYLFKERIVYLVRPRVSVGGIRVGFASGGEHQMLWGVQACLWCLSSDEWPMCLCAPWLHQLDSAAS